MLSMKNFYIALGVLAITMPLVFCSSSSTDRVEPASKKETNVKDNPSDSILTLIAVGDIMLGTNYPIHQNVMPFVNPNISWIT